MGIELRHQFCVPTISLETWSQGSVGKVLMDPGGCARLGTAGETDLASSCAWVPPSCQAANSTGLLPNTNAAGVRGRWPQILLQALGLQALA